MLRSPKRSNEKFLLVENVLLRWSLETDPERVRKHTIKVIHNVIIPQISLTRRECAALNRVPICHIFNQSISQGKLPEDWKSARVAPLFKQGDRDDVNNYRQISVIPEL